MKHHNSERRCAERIAISLPATLVYGDQNFQSKALDISLCGMSLITDKKLPENQPIQISISLPSYEQSNIINLSANVIRCSSFKTKFLHGMVFKHLNPHQKLVIQEFSSFHNRLN